MFVCYKGFQKTPRSETLLGAERVGGIIRSLMDLRIVFRSEFVTKKGLFQSTASWPFEGLLRFGRREVLDVSESASRG